MLSWLSACFGGRQGLDETRACEPLPAPHPPSSAPGALEEPNERKCEATSDNKAARSQCNDSSPPSQALATNSESRDSPTTTDCPLVSNTATAVLPPSTSPVKEATFVVVNVSGSSKVSQTLGSEQLTNALQRLDDVFAELCVQHGLQRMRFTGQARPLIACCSNLGADESPSGRVQLDCAPAPHQDWGAHKMMAFARELLTASNKALAFPEGVLPFKIGVHTGPCSRLSTSSTKIDSESPMFQTVAVAICIEHTGTPGRIHASERTVALLQPAGDGRSEEWEATEAGVNVQGLGTLCTHYWAPPRTELRRGPMTPRQADPDELTPPSRSPSTSSVMASFQAMNQLLHLVYASQRSNNSASQTLLSSTSQLNSLPALLSTTGSNGGVSTGSLYAGLLASRVPSASNLGSLMNRSGESFTTGRACRSQSTVARPVPFANFSNVIMEALKNPNPINTVPVCGSRLSETPAR